jgi:tRNA(fMet)-specific endonuclease VapC
MLKYMLDTNVCVDMIREKKTFLIDQMTQLVVGDAGMSSITLAELEYGV